VRPVIERCRGPVEQALRDAGVTPKDINRIVFVGESTLLATVEQEATRAVRTDKARSEGYPIVASNGQFFSRAER
jgi:molecular chaperone DnaK (HSP70)